MPTGSGAFGRGTFGNATGAFSSFSLGLVTGDMGRSLPTGLLMGGEQSSEAPMLQNVINAQNDELI